MSEESEIGGENYEAFVEAVKASREVWGLCRDEEEWAYSASSEYEDAEVLLFWSSKKLAAAHQQDEWKQHQPTAIELDDFIENWLPGVDEDGGLIGPNWTTDFEGWEVLPEDLAERLIEE